MKPNPPSPSQTGPLSQDHLSQDKLDPILLDDAILPSSGFAASVMESIAAEEAAKAVPAPIPFPWKLALPTLAAIILALIAAIRLATEMRQSLTTHPGLARLNITWLMSSPLASQTLPAIAAIAGAFLCLVLTRYLAVGRSSH